MKFIIYFILALLLFASIMGFADYNTITYDELYFNPDTARVEKMPYMCSSSSQINYTIFSKYRFFCAASITQNPHYGGWNNTYELEKRSK